MTRYVLVVAVLLTTWSGVAAAAEIQEPGVKSWSGPEATTQNQDPGRKSKNAQKVFAVLGAIGLNDKKVRDFVDEVDSHVDKNFVNFAERKTLGGGRLKLRYNMGPRTSLTGPNLGGRLSMRRFELSFQPSEQSHFEYTAGSNRLMVNYHLEF